MNVDSVRGWCRWRVLLMARPAVISMFWGSLLIFHIPTITAELIHSRNHFLASLTNKQNKLDKKTEGSTSFSLLKASSLKIGWPHVNSTNKIHNPIGISLLTCVCLCLSHLNDFLNQILLMFLLNMRQIWKTGFILASSLWQVTFL